MTIPTVLVVDDEPFIRMLLADGLSMGGFDVVEAASADEALKVLDGGAEVAALITDVKMPGSMDGLGLAQTVACRWSSMPILVVSGHVSPDDPRLPAEVTLIRKPFRVDDVETHLKSTLR